MADVTALLWSRSTPIFGAVLPVGRNDGGPKNSADHRQGEAGGVSGNQGSFIPHNWPFKGGE